MLTNSGACIFFFFFFFFTHICDKFIRPLNLLSGWAVYCDLCEHILSETLACMCQWDLCGFIWILQIVSNLQWNGCSLLVGTYRETIQLYGFTSLQRTMDYGVTSYDPGGTDSVFQSMSLKIKSPPRVMVVSRWLHVVGSVACCCCCQLQSPVAMPKVYRQVSLYIVFLINALYFFMNIQSPKLHFYSQIIMPYISSAPNWCACVIRWIPFKISFLFKRSSFIR